MFVTRNDERLFLSSWNYNALLIISELANIVQGNGGRTKPYRNAIISNRTLDGEIRDCTHRLSILERANDRLCPDGNRLQEIKDIRSKLCNLSMIDNTPVKTIGQSWLKFIIGNQMYYYSVDDNPFFDFYYSKTHIDDQGYYSLDACCEADNKSWFRDSFLYCACKQSDRASAAQEIFDMLTAAPNSYIKVDSIRKRVPNTFDGGYHYEYIRDKERRERIDF